MQVEQVAPLVSEKLQEKEAQKKEALIRDQAADSNTSRSSDKRKRRDSAKVRANKKMAAAVRPKQSRRSV